MVTPIPPGVPETVDGASSIEPDHLIRIAVEAAQAAGELLLSRQSGIRQAATKSSPTDPVTDADRAAEHLIVAAIRTTRPDDAVRAEEGTELPGTSPLRWLIDPLDGTVNYLYQRRGWAVSVAVEDSAGTLVGVVADPIHGEVFHAARGRGAYLSGQRLRVNDRVPRGLALVGTGFSYTPDARRRQAQLMTTLLPAVRDIRRTGTCAGDLCALAAGRLDAFLEDELSPWDWAAGALIAREAGATVTPLRADSASPGLLAAGPVLHAELSHLINPLT